MEVPLDEVNESDRRLLRTFNQSLCGLIDAYDAFGRGAGLHPAEKIERMLLFSPEEKRASGQDCAPSPKLRRQVEQVFQAMAVTLEAETRCLVQSMVEMNAEGFGRAIVSSGRLILVSTTLRAGLRFPFASGAKLERFALTCLKEALGWLTRHRDLASSG